MPNTQRILKYLKDPIRIVWPLANHNVFNWMPDEQYLRLIYRGRMGKKLDLKSPQTFNEKLQWLKLYDRNPLYHTFVDKYEMKEYASKIIGKEHIIPTIGVWDTPEEIPFHEFPNQFVIKCTHDCGSIVICQDKNTFDIESAKEKLKKCLKDNLFWEGREWPYKDLKPRIIAEPYFDDGTGQLKDYKFFCFNGEAKCFKIDFDRRVFHRANYYSRSGEQLPFGEVTFPPDYSGKIALPNRLDTMLKLADKLAENIPFIRVDFYEVDNTVYLGELTLFPSSGFRPFTDEHWDYTLGSWLKLPEKRA